MVRAALRLGPLLSHTLLYLFSTPPQGLPLRALVDWEAPPVERPERRGRKAKEGRRVRARLGGALVTLREVRAGASAVDDGGRLELEVTRGAVLRDDVVGMGTACGAGLQIEAASNAAAAVATVELLASVPQGHCLVFSNAQGEQWAAVGGGGEVLLFEGPGPRNLVPVGEAEEGGPAGAAWDAAFAEAWWLGDAAPATLPEEVVGDTELQRAANASSAPGWHEEYVDMCRTEKEAEAEVEAPPRAPAGKKTPEPSDLLAGAEAAVAPAYETLLRARVNKKALVTRTELRSAVVQPLVDVLDAERAVRVLRDRVVKRPSALRKQYPPGQSDSQLKMRETLMQVFLRFEVAVLSGEERKEEKKILQLLNLVNVLFYTPHPDFNSYMEDVLFAEYGTVVPRMFAYLYDKFTMVSMPAALEAFLSEGPPANKRRSSLLDADAGPPKARRTSRPASSPSRDTTADLLASVGARASLRRAAPRGGVQSLGSAARVSSFAQSAAAAAKAKKEATVRDAPLRRSTRATPLKRRTVADTPMQERPRRAAAGASWKRTQSSANADVFVGETPLRKKLATPVAKRKSRATRRL